MKGLIESTLVLGCLLNGMASAGEFCHGSKCWQYEEVADARVGGMQLEDGKYIRADHTTRTANEEKTKSQRVTTLVVSGNFVDVDIFSFEERSPGNQTKFSFQYDLAANKLVEGKTEVREENETTRQRIAESIPQIADDLLQNHGNYSSGESIEYSQTVRIRGDRMETHHVLTLLGKIRHQGEYLIIIRSDYTFELASVSGKATGYLMQDMVTSMPRYTAHQITMNVGDEVVTMKSKGYVSILAR